MAATNKCCIWIFSKNYFSFPWAAIISLQAFALFNKCNIRCILKFRFCIYFKSWMLIEHGIFEQYVRMPIETKQFLAYLNNCNIWRCVMRLFNTHTKKRTINIVQFPFYWIQLHSIAFKLRSSTNNIFTTTTPPLVGIFVYNFAGILQKLRSIAAMLLQPFCFIFIAYRDFRFADRSKYRQVPRDLNWYFWYLVASNKIRLDSMQITLGHIQDLFYVCDIIVPIAKFAIHNSWEMRPSIYVSALMLFVVIVVLLCCWCWCWVVCKQSIIYASNQFLFRIYLHLCEGCKKSIFQVLRVGVNGNKKDNLQHLKWNNGFYC